LIEKRRNGELEEEESVYYNKNRDEIRINTDSGRVLRPVVIVEDGEPRLTEDQMDQLEDGEITLKIL